MFLIKRPIGVPVVIPSKVPDTILIVSDSLLWVVCLELPGFLKFKSPCKSSSDNAIPGGQPSTIPMRASPWLSPAVVKVNSFPNELPDIVY